jgi:hypothetical protein
MTTEQLATTHKRANEYALARHGKEPNEIELCSDGLLRAKYIDYVCGEIGETYHYISPEMLTEDLDVVAEQRRKEEEERRIKAEIERQKLLKIQEEQKKEKRKQLYLELLKEFGNQ